MYDANLFNISGFAEWERQYGSYFSFSETPRAQIFRRQFQNVVECVSDRCIRTLSLMQH